MRVCGCCRARWLGSLRFPIACYTYLRDGWNSADLVNYIFFSIAFGIRVYTLDLMPGNLVDPIKAQLNDIYETTGAATVAAAEGMDEGALGGLNRTEVVRRAAREAQYSQCYVNFTALAAWYARLLNIYALNSVLTWIKILKYLDFHPQMTILIATLRKGAKSLAIFMLTLAIVLVGYGQAFFMSFGLEVYSYRDLWSSAVALLRMSLGDFDYAELAQANPLTGPPLFWLYLVVVFFIMMSMFIALISEAYDDARKSADVRQQSGHIRGTLHTRTTNEAVIREAEKRLEMTGDTSLKLASTGLISQRMWGHLAPFRDAAPRFAAQAMFAREESEAVLARARTTARRRHRTEAQLDRVSNGVRSKGASTADRGRETAAASTSTAGGIKQTLCGGLLSNLGQSLEWKLYWSKEWFEKASVRAHGRRYRATHEFPAVNPKKQLSLKVGDIIVVVSAPPQVAGEPPKLWRGYHQNQGPGRTGTVFHQMLTLLPDLAQENQQQEPVDLSDGEPNDGRDHDDPAELDFHDGARPHESSEDKEGSTRNTDGGDTSRSSDPSDGEDSDIGAVMPRATRQHRRRRRRRRERQQAERVDVATLEQQVAAAKQQLSELQVQLKDARMRAPTQARLFLILVLGVGGGRDS